MPYRRFLLEYYHYGGLKDKPATGTWEKFSAIKIIV
jgi:hypothetical protein